jgi:NAD(P) transhydrogenase subunit beta
MHERLIDVAYLISSILFIFGLKALSHPRSAVRGNLIGSLGMLIAIVATLVHHEVLTFGAILAGVVVGSAIGLIFAIRVEMTAMPQMVALFNGFGGGASLVVAGAELFKANLLSLEHTVEGSIATGASCVIGAVTLLGSLVAFAKLQGLMTEKPILVPARHLLNLALAVGSIALTALLVIDPTSILLYLALSIVASLLGVFLTIPIGGADMPVVISLLNSYSGLAAAATGFVLSNNSLIIAGSLVGASGIILTSIMCKAMNRSLANVFFGGLGAVVSSGPSADDVYGGRIKATSADEVAMLFDTAQRVVMVPGYGLAVSQAQHQVRDLANMLQARGIEVEYAIHPVAGRMPGHMNVLLAEADIPYDQLKEMDVINPTFEQTDVTLVLGANDVVNPDARENPTSPIAGMPILNVDKSRTVVVVKRSLSPGFAGIPNPLFAADNTLMFFADGKQALLDLIAAVKENA